MSICKKHVRQINWTHGPNIFVRLRCSYAFFILSFESLEFYKKIKVKVDCKFSIYRGSSVRADSTCAFPTDAQFQKVPEIFMRICIALMLFLPLHWWCSEQCRILASKYFDLIGTYSDREHFSENQNQYELRTRCSLNMYVYLSTYLFAMRLLVNL